MYLSVLNISSSSTSTIVSGQFTLLITVVLIFLQLDSIGSLSTVEVNQFSHVKNTE